MLNDTNSIVPCGPHHVAALAPNLRGAVQSGALPQAVVDSTGLTNAAMLGNVVAAVWGIRPIGAHVELLIFISPVFYAAPPEFLTEVQQSLRAALPEHPVIECSIPPTSRDMLAFLRATGFVPLEREPLPHEILLRQDGYESRHIRLVLERKAI